MIDKKALANFTKHKRNDVLAKMKNKSQMDDEKAHRVFGEIMREEFKFWSFLNDVCVQ